MYGEMRAEIEALFPRSRRSIRSRSERRAGNAGSRRYTCRLTTPLGSHLETHRMRRSPAVTALLFALLVPLTACKTEEVKAPDKLVAGPENIQNYREESDSRLVVRLDN